MQEQTGCVTGGQGKAGGTEQRLAYWEQHLLDAPAPLGLPADHSRSVLRGPALLSDPLSLPGPLNKKLHSLSSRHGVSLPAMLLSAFLTLLWRYTGQDDVLLTCAVADPHALDAVADSPDGSAASAGLNAGVPRLACSAQGSAHVFPLRAGLSAQTDFASLVRLVQTQLAESHARACIPLGLLPRALNGSGEPRHRPLAQILFSFGDALRSSLTASRSPGGNGGDDSEPAHSPAELALHATQTRGRLRLSLEYDAQLFEPNTISRMLGHLRVLLEGVAADPSLTLAVLPLLTDEERRQLLRDWNQTHFDFPRDACIHELIEQQAWRQPDHTALFYGDCALTYAELNTRANQLAHRLRELGVGRNTPVGICVERSVEMVVGLLGILKAGGAYLPLDPAYPKERLAFMLGDAGVSVLLTQQRLLNGLPEDDGRSTALLCLDSDWPLVARHSTETPRTGVEPTDLVYVIYTSGSTGRPKGVMVDHRGRVNNFADFNHRFGIGPDDRVIALNSLSFDMCAYDVLGSLMAGATIILPLAERLREPAHWADLVGQRGVTVWHSVPAMMEMLIEYAAGREDFDGRSLRLALLGGDWISVTLPDRLRPLTSNVHVVSLGGATEVSMDSTVFRIERTDSEWKSIPYGRPLANQQAYVLDERLQPQPIGVPGELHLGGEGVGWGYLHRSDLTAEKFIPHPFAERAGERLYKTGDLCRYRPDGNLELLGRIDFQVKIRGYRIELGEIVSTLRQHPDVQEAVVLAKSDEAGGKRLVAYVVGKADARPSRDALSDYLRERLPDYMIPSSFVLLGALPLTPNGKVDRPTLAALEYAAAESAGASESPRTPLEEALAAIWSELLGTERVGVGDNFFELGGHSLLATRLVSRVRAHWQVELPLRAVFACPTLADMAAQIEEARLSGAVLQALPITHVEHGGSAPASFAQQRLWFIEQLTPGTAVYNIGRIVELSGSLDAATLERSLNEIVRRHEVLRTSFAMSESEPVQVIEPEARLQLAPVDLSGLPEEERRREARRLGREEAARPFDLGRAPLLRVRLLRLSSDEHVLLLTMHHIVSDGWSMGIFVRELSQLYAAFSRGLPSRLPELAVQYADYARWQREWLQGGVLDAQLDYWREQLVGVSNLELPTDKARPAVLSPRGHTLRRLLPGALRDSLQQLSYREGVTLYMTLLAAFQTLLARYSGQEDIVVGSPVANRNHAEVENLIGFFVNMLVLRSRCDARLSFSELLQQVKETALDAYARQDVPFERLVEELQAERDLARNPIFQVAFALQNAPSEKLELKGLALREHDAEEETAKFDLTLLVEERLDGLQASFTYHSDLFEEATARRMLLHWQQLLEAAASDPRRRLSELDFISEEERRRVLVEWNSTSSDYPKERCVQQLFEEQAAHTPDAVAVSYGEDELCYAELNRRANQLAHRLRKTGVGAETTVCLLMERGVEIVIGLLGTVKAGGTYVPLDPSYPRERLRQILGDAQPRVVLTQRHLRDVVESALAPPQEGAVMQPVLDGPELLVLDEEGAALARESEENCENINDAEDLIYIIYTSGSTGRPKGVAVPHRAVTRLVKGSDYVRLDAADRVAQASNASFDAITFEVWGALLNGARLVGIGKNVALSPQALSAALKQERISTLFLTTALFNQVVGEAPTAFSGLRHMLFGGEAVDVKSVREVLRQGRPQRLLHVYGPTESTTFATWQLVQGVGDEARTVPIGRPIANTQAYVLDEQMSPIPQGVNGELYLGGDGLARGYRHRPALTAERFIPDPFSSAPGARLYRTGDVVRLLDGGAIEFVGRADRQVKLRGFRVEPGEIESALLAHAGVREAVVEVHEAAVTGRRLVAYVVAEPGTQLSAGAARAYLRSRLPDYMIPSAFVTLDALPLTPNGKVDRRALPTPDWSRAGADEGAMRPRTPAEELLVDIWSEVLEIEAERLSIRESFFDLGGHSLLAMQVVSRVRKIFGVELPVRVLFQSPTVEGVAEWLATEALAGEGATPPPITRASREGEGPLSFAQQRIWFLNQLEPNQPFYNVPVELRLTGRLDVPVLERALNEIVRRHETLRTTFISVDGQPVQKIADELKVGINVVDLRRLPEEARAREARRLIEDETQTPFDLSVGPVLRFLLLHLSAEEHILLLSMHHIVSDGWSVAVFVREAAALYEAFKRGEPSPLQELAIQYADFARWQREWLSGDVLNSQLGYWKRQLEGAPTLLELPTDRPRPAVQSFHGASIDFEIPPDLNEGLEALSRREGVTLFMTLLVAFQTLLARYSDQTDILVGSPIANRNYADIEHLIGFFVNTLVLRSDLSGNPSFGEAAGRVRDSALAAYAHQDVPIEMLVEAVQPERHLGHSPLFQVVFTMQNAPAPGAEFADLTLQCITLANRTAKFDLVLDMTSDERGLYGYLEYNTDLFNASTIERMLDHFKRLLANIVADPERPLLEQPLLTADERARFLFDWNETQADYPRDKTIQRLVEEQAERTPSALALVCGDAHATYEDLNRRANRLAHLLRRLGAGPGARVGLCLTHSPETVVAILGVLKAGAAYVPLDPEHPRSRIAFVVEDAGLPVVIAQRKLAHGLPAGAAEVICLDDDARLAGEPDENPSWPATPDDPAYVIYTSGSTGQPKGVQIRQRALVNYIWWAARVYLQDEPLSFALFSTLAFDLTVTSVFTPLVTGNRIVIYPSRGRDLPLFDILQDGRVGVLKLTPSHLALIKGQDNRQSSVRRLIVGGEALTTELARQVSSSFGGNVEIYNEYGPTEATVGCMIYRFDPARDERAMVPIGRPAANSQIYVLDERAEPTAENLLGELYIAGDGLADGYLNRDELTHAKFVENPFGAGRRMYRTGDLARRLVDGNLEYVGRRDEQVKFHGYRVELNEIKGALNRHPQIRDSVIVVRKDQSGGDLMVAYYVARQEIETASLREWLAEQIIEETIPNVFIYLKRLPLTLNGKINYEALPDVAEATPKLARPSAAARTPVEEALLEVWGEVLGAGQIGINDNFFELGGHSLLATLVISRACEIFQIDLPLRSLFQSPTIAGLAEKIESALRAGKIVQPPPVIPIPRDGELPLSFAQQRLWFLSQLEPDSPFYNVPIAIHMGGALDAAALEAAFDEIVRRHEALRTTFVNVEGQPVQQIADEQKVRLDTTDLRHLPDEERAVEVERIAFDEARTPFDPAAGPLLRVRLLRLGGQEHVLLLTMHHIVSDGWSVGVLIRELSALYGAYARGEESPLAALPVQYADFAAWQREWLSGDVLDAQFDYWKRQLEGVSGVLELPTDYPRPLVQSYRGALTSFDLPPELAARLRELGRESGATLYMTLLAAFNVLLYRYTGQRDILVGSPIANRNRAETENLIGFFVNALLLRTDLSGDPTFEELLARVREVALEAYANKDAPFEKLVEELHPERDLSRHPLFQVIFALQNVSAERFSLPGLKLKTLPVDNRTSMFDLSLLMEESPSGLSGIVQYSTDLFSPATIQRLISHFRTLLEAVAARPQQRVSDLPLLTAQEQRQVLVEWKGETTEYGAHFTIAQLFEAQVERAPEAAALLFEAQSLSYARLNERANQLAHYLRRRGVGPEVLVGICMKRSPEMVVALLGILKAGGAYLPLDPDYPMERLAVMLEDARPALLLTEGHLIGSLPAQPTTDLIALDELGPQLDSESTQNPPAAGCSANLAYLMYTSGSTGRPKAIAVTHRGVVRLVRETNYADFTPEQVFLQFAPLSFDASTFELWGALLNGARLALPPAHGASTEELAAAIRDNGVTTLWLTASLFHLMVDAQAEALRGVRQLLAGGDVLSADHVRRLLREAPGCTLINGYGPTENTTFTCCHRISGWEDVGRSVPIGIPISNTEVFVLDARMYPIPPGVEGELYAGGEGLARCYLGEPAMTAERFVPHPFSNRPGERLYRTGDLVRFLSDGTLEFVGRADRQVKVRGFRIELGEVEAALLAHDAVREAVVLALDGAAAAGKRLVAYFIGEDGARPGAGELRGYLRSRLPEYMIPSAFVLLDALPMTPSGKIDRRALPAPDWQGAASDDASAAPRTPIEELLASAWAEVLEVDPQRLGVGDNFFDLGGHSLLATQIVSRVRKLFSVEMPVRTVFQAASIAEMAAWIQAQLRAGGSAQSLPMTRVSRDEALPLSFAQQRLWFLAQLEPDNPFYNIPLVLRLEGALDVTSLERALEEIVRRHEALRTTFVSVDGQPVQVIVASRGVRIEFVDLQDLPEGEREGESRRLIEEDARRPFDLSAGPLLRAGLLRLDESEHVLLLTMHHIVSDGWSLGVLLRELSALYSAFTQGEASSLAELTIQYADFARWQREWLQGGVLDAQLDYWKRQLGGAPTVLDLPTDHARPLVQTYRGAHLDFDLPPELAARLRELARQSGATLYMTLLAAFNVLLFRYTGQRDILVGSPIANRNRAETENLIGFFVNTLVLRTQLDDEESFEQLLAHTREAALEAYANQDVPFEKLVEELQPERNLSRHPLFQVAFALQNTPMPRLELPGLIASLYDYEPGTANFDLWVELFEIEGRTAFSFEYNTDLFEPSTIARMYGHWQQLLEAVARDPRRRISQLPLLTEPELEQLLVRWCDTRAPFPTDLCVHQLFERQAALTPAAPALSFGEAVLSYGELERRANQLARYLRRQGGGAEQRVVLCAERSLEMVVGLLGILKAGAAYVPLDPSYPQERLSFVLEDAEATVLLTQERLLDRVASGGASQRPTLCLDRDWPLLAKEEESALEGVVSPDNLAYVIYTSGSTGRPKGVLVAHRNLMHSTQARLSYYQQPVSGFLLLSSFAFDSSVAGIFWTLCGGGTLILPDAELQHDPAYLMGLIRRGDVSHLLCLPSLYKLLLEHSQGRALEGLEAVIVAGEACPAELVESHYGKLSEVSLFNEYGPTEGTVWSSVYNCRFHTAGRQVPIGKAIDNMQLYVLDAELNPLPVGVSGELYIGGEGLARGYLSRPGLTAERFIPHPYSEQAGARLYRTGDVVRHLADGNLEFLGRVDQQVKIRGYRIELGEIEAALREHPAVGEAVTVVKDWGVGVAARLAYLSNNGGAAAAAQTLTKSVQGLESKHALRLLEELEALTDEEVEARLRGEQTKEETTEGKRLHRVRRHEKFKVSLQLTSDQFIAPPSDFQRDWIVNKALEEFSADLLHLDSVARRFVPGKTVAAGSNGAGAHLGLEERQIMEDWQIPIMEAMAKAAAEHGGDVLEVGFGRGISAGFIQRCEPRSHTVIECDDDVIRDFERWREQYPGRDIRLIRGRWQDVVDQLGTYDGIFFHTSTSTEEEFTEHVVKSVTYAEHFFPAAAEHLRKGGVFTYLTLEIDSFSRRHQRLVLKYFESLTLAIQPLQMPEDCRDMWWADSMVLVKAVR